MPTQPQNESMAYRLCGMNVAELRPTSGKAPDLPKTLVIPPGSYRILGRTWSLKQQGLYRFFLPGGENHQRIIYRDDVFALLSAISWLCSHGNRDNGKTFDEKCAIALNGKLIVTCGDISQFAHQLLGRLGVASRQVASTTLHDLNTYNNGHVLLEAMLDGRWVLVDLDTKRMFLKRGKRLSLLEFSQACIADDYRFEMISAAVPLAVGLFTIKDYDYDLWMETAFGDEAAVRTWYQRVMMIPIQIDNGSWFTTRSSADLRRFQKLYADRGMKYLPLAEYRRRFYPK